MRVLLCLIMAAFTLNMSAFAGEVWVLDLDDGPVVINEDGSTEAWDLDFSLITEEPASDVGTPVTPDPVPAPVEDPPVAKVPSSDSEVEIITEEVYEEDMFLLDIMEEPEFVPYAISELDDPEYTRSLDPEEQTMKDVVVMILGDYSPRTQTVTQYLSDGSSESYTEIVPGVAGMDWEWISGAALFALVLFSFFKFVGVIFRNG